MTELERIAQALESLVDYRRHTCGPCDGVGSVIASFDRKDSMGMERDFTGVDVIPFALPQFEYDFVNVRVRCQNCDGTGRIVPKEQPSAATWSPEEVHHHTWLMGGPDKDGKPTDRTCVYMGCKAHEEYSETLGWQRS